MKHRKGLRRVTFSQERFEILIKKQKNGEASFSDLVELDEIVNRVPDIRHIILEEIEGTDTPPDESGQQDTIIAKENKPQGLLEKIKSFFNQLFFLADSPVISV
ncbi:hypothetical protein SAMN05216490_2457 [Mucilaginibacter mallensis]|uniref:Uncharacterized protein n=1 Tax=Mucilaginibacter mallensis TaxID=652787 RepID=A0A1H1XI33_MUCMA|nr:hypothetical protein [Mucilaginibacter mallensis]SDT08840.1 hypothetical protein SAMN05216490_2457 [Mucilaginibacter mallensis]